MLPAKATVISSIDFSNYHSYKRTNDTIYKTLLSIHMVVTSGISTKFYFISSEIYFAIKWNFEG